MTEQSGVSRRNFIVTMAAAGVAMQGLPGISARAQDANMGHDFLRAEEAHGAPPVAWVKKQGLFKAKEAKTS